MSNYTPGPWVWGKSDRTGERIILWGTDNDFNSRTGSEDADLPVLSHRIFVNPDDGVAFHEFDIAEPDANLIAAAPDLLAALESILPIILDTRDEAVAARAAIAKARGTP